MSWISDAVSDKIRSYGNFGTAVGKALGLNDYSSFIQSELVDKADLRGTQIEGFASGLPIAGGLIKGVDNVEQLEDLYNTTGKTVQYAGNQTSGLSSAGKSVGQLANKIADGTHDLHAFYSGDTADIWSQVSNKANWNSKYHHYREKMI